MPEISAAQLQEWTSGIWSSKPSTNIGSVVHDSRQMRPDALYVAIRGERFDGHDFIENAFELGGSAALVEKGRALPGRACLEVEDTSRALLDLAAGYRSLLGGLIVGITGSAGKTTVKELIVSILSQRGDTCATPGNWNNQVGMPLSLLAMERSDNFGVFEVGMNQPGEIGLLSGILKPICGVLTSIGMGHVGAFESVDGIADEKVQLLRALPPEGVAILDRDSRRFDFCCASTDARIVSCSLREEQADYFGQPNDDGSMLTVVDRLHDRTFSIPMPLPGSHMMRNVMQAIAVAGECGVSSQEIVQGLQDFDPPAMRWQTEQVAGRTVINDAYNANPVSMRSAIKTFAGMNGFSEKWLVLGSMRELGGYERDAHLAVGSELSRYTWRGLIVVGEIAYGIAVGAAAEGAAIGCVYQVQTVEEASEILREQAGADAGVLLKASRLDRLERVLDELREPAGERS